MERKKKLKLKYIILSLILIILFLISVVVLNINLDGEKTMYRMEEQLQSLEDISITKLRELSQKKLFFGHQSVGFNIIDGINDIMNDNPELKLNFVEYNSLSDFNTSNFVHAIEGNNTEPDTKLDSFSEHIKEGIGGIADFAFLKLCYVDFNADSDINKIFDYYRSSMEQLKQSYPETTFIHLTAPIVSQKIDIITGIKNMIKRIIGKPVNEIYLSNIKRTQFNELMIETYEGKEPLFDLARVESMFLDGKRQYHELNGNIYYSMIPEYTDDGGHLNEKGRRFVAEQFIIFLTGLL